MIKTPTANEWWIHKWNTGLPGLSLLCAVFLGHLAPTPISVPINGLLMTSPLDTERWLQLSAPVSVPIRFLVPPLLDLVTKIRCHV